MIAIIGLRNRFRRIVRREVFRGISLSDFEQRSNMKDALKKQGVGVKISGITTKGILTKHKTIDLW